MQVDGADFGEDRDAVEDDVEDPEVVAGVGAEVVGVEEVAADDEGPSLGSGSSRGGGALWDGRLRSGFAAEAFLDPVEESGEAIDRFLVVEVDGLFEGGAGVEEDGAEEGVAVGVFGFEVGEESEDPLAGTTRPGATDAAV